MCWTLFPVKFLGCLSAVFRPPQSFSGTRRRLRQLDCTVGRWRARQSTKRALAVWRDVVSGLRDAERRAFASLPSRPRKREVTLVTKHFLTAQNIKSRRDLEHHKLAHEAELSALKARDCTGLVVVEGVRVRLCWLVWWCMGFVCVSLVVCWWFGGGCFGGACSCRAWRLWVFFGG